MHTLWNSIFYQPIYNALIFIINTITLGDVGFAIIILTIVVKLILLPLTKKSIKSQILMKKMEPEIKQIKKDFPNKEEQAKKTFELYKKYGTNPFSGCLVALLQLPIVLTVYYIFRNLSVVNAPLYHFIHAPTIFNINFLGVFELHSKSIILAVLAGISQFILGYLASPMKPKVEIVKEMPASDTPKNFQEQMSEGMQTNMKYFLPFLIVYIAYQYSVVVALYLITTNIFSIIQEWYIRRKLENSLT